MSDSGGIPRSSRREPCPDVDELMELSVALGEDPESRLRHLLECDGCRTSLRAAARLRAPVHGTPASRIAVDDAERFLATFDPTSIGAPPGRTVTGARVARVAAVAASALTGVCAVLLVAARTVEVSPLGALAAAVLGVVVMAVGEGRRPTTA